MPSRRHGLPFAVAFFALVSVAGGAGATATFEIAVENDFAAARNVSPDGVWTVDDHASADAHGFRYSNGTIQTLVSSFNGAGAHGASRDGSVVVGVADLEAWRWEGGTLQFLGFLPGGSESFACDISWDASTIVGRSGSLAFVHQGGVMNSLGDLAGGGTSSEAQSATGFSGRPRT